MKAVILLAGKGTRLRPHTHYTPKSPIRVAGTPVLDYILDDHPKAGVSEVAGFLHGLRATILKRGQLISGTEPGWKTVD